MPDVLDDIIDKLPQSTLKMILEMEDDRSKVCSNVDNLLQEMRQIKVKQLNDELSRKTFCTKSKTEENRNRVQQLRKEFERGENFRKPDNNLKSLEAYISKTNELELQLKSLIRDQGDVDFTQLFHDVENLHGEILAYEKKVTEERKKCRRFDGFPPDIEQGKQVMAKIKENIKKNQNANK